jgi:hypothetical protein
MGATELHQDEAVLLAHALVARLAEDVGARVLFIKGPTAVAQGVRPSRPSADVDVLVDPTAFEALCAAIESAGWRRRFGPSPLAHIKDLSFEHSAHFIHDGWPCDLDVHFTFPGFFAEPGLVFAALWEQRSSQVVAGRPVTTPDVLGQSLVVGLHALRDPHRPKSRADLEHLAALLTRTLDDAGRASLAELSVVTGARDSARELLESAGIDVDGPATPSPKLAAWEIFQEFGDTAGSMWLVELRRARWRERPGLLARAALPPRSALFGPDLAGTATRRQVAGAQLARWARALTALPRAAVILRRLRRSPRS